VILSPGIVSRLDALEESTVLGDMEPEDRAGFKGNATFNATRYNCMGTFVKIKIAWTEDGKLNEKTLPDEAANEI